MLLLTAIFLILLIWLAIKFGGIRKAKPSKAQERAPRRIPSKGGLIRKVRKDEPSQLPDFQGKGGRFGGAGSTGSWDDGDRLNADINQD